MPHTAPAAPATHTLRSGRMTVVLGADGARLLGLYLHQADGRRVNVALGLAGAADYPAQDSYIGAVCGRFANRIRHARFALDGRTIALSANEGEHHLHGGEVGFDRRHWRAEQHGDDAVSFHLRVPDGDQGYPGALTVTATYRLVAETSLQCELTARSDRPTVVNLTHHAYWNLSGDFGRSAAGHQLWVDADSYLPVDAQQIPLPGRRPVAGTAFDFLRPAGLADRLGESGGGFDHNFCLKGQRGVLRPVATLEDPASGRTLELLTTEAGLQLYLARHFTPQMRSREGQRLHPAAAIALEPQTFPDSPNRPDFPSPRLQPGDTYRHLIEWRFGLGG